MIDDALLWRVRTFIYRHFTATTSAPQHTDIARHFDLSREQANAVLLALHEIHTLFLEPRTTNIRIANPFSAVPTPFVVEVEGKRYSANCAWDSFGVIAALQASAGLIRSICTQDGMSLHLQIQSGEVVNTNAVIHFLVPFRQWYQDLVFT